MNREEVQKECLKLLDGAFAKAQETYLAKSPMREMLSYHFASGGKRLRPLCSYFAAYSYAQKKGLELGELFQKCTPYALAVELTHNATLIHDDIQDGDRVRRDQETLWVKYSLAQGINCGDAWFFVPQLLLQDYAYEAELKLALLSLLQRKTLAVIEGQSEEFVLKERFAQGEEISVSQYMRMVDGKTSALFSMPLVGGAMIAGASPLECKALEQAALQLGHAFQIQDDMLDLWGSKGRDIIGSDIAEGKLSYPLVLLLDKLPRNREERKKLVQIVRAPRENTSSADIQWVIELMEKEGVKEKARQDFSTAIREARMTAFWEEVVGFLAEMLEDKVKQF